MVSCRSLRALPLLLAMAHGEALGNIDEGADEEACEMQQTLLQTKVGLRSVQQTNEHIASVMEVDSAIDKEQAEANETSHQSTCPIGRRIRNPFGFQCAMVLSAGGTFGDQCQIQYDNGQTDELHAMHCAEDDRCPQPTTGPASVEPVVHQTHSYGDVDMESALSDCPHGRIVSLESWVSHTRCATIVERASSEPPTCLIRFDDGHTMRLGASDMGLSDDCPQPTFLVFSPNSCALPGSRAWCSPCNLQGGCLPYTARSQWYSGGAPCTEENFSPDRDYNCCADGAADCNEVLLGGATSTSMLQSSEEGRQVQPIVMMALQSSCPIGRRIRNPFGFQCAMVLSAGGAFGDQCQIQYDNGQTDELHAMHCEEDDRCPQPTTGPASVEPVHHQTTNYGDADMESALSDCPHGRTVSLESWVSHTRCATIVERASSEPPTCLIRFDDGHTMRLGPSDMGLSDDCPQPTMTTTTTPIPPFFSPNSCALPGSTAWCSPCNLQGGCMNRFTCTEHNFSPHRDYNCCADGMADCDEALHGGATWTSMLQSSEEGRQVQPSDDGFATW